MSSGQSIGVGIVGMGFMGRTHLAAYQAAHRAGLACRVVAVCDREAERLAAEHDSKGNIARGGAGFDPGQVRTYTAVESLLADPAVQLVSVCTHTDTHVDLALRCLAAGKHVLVEKPLALTAADARRVAAAARGAKTLCMPAMCMRFWPGWSWVREQIVSNAYGPVRSAVFERLASPPAWGADFYRDASRAGGALIDLHIHDADFVRWCFGAPRAVSSTGSLDHLTTLYRYKTGPQHVVAEGGWDHTPGFPFFMGFTVVFERATAVFALGREPLLEVYRDGRGEGIALEPGTGYDGEVRHMLEVVAGRAKARATVAEAVGLVAMLEAERKSLARGKPVTL